MHSGLRIASKHFSIERRRQQNTRTSESSNQIRGWWKGREQGGEEEAEEKKKDALGYGLFGARSHRKCLFRNSLVFLLSFYLIYSEISFFLLFHFVSFCCCCFAVFLNSRHKNCAKRSRQPVYFDLLSKCCLCQVISSSPPPLHPSAFHLHLSLQHHSNHPFPTPPWPHLTLR